MIVHEASIFNIELMTALGITLCNGTQIQDPFGRVKEYCRVEIYRGYDDQHSIDNKITLNDVQAANRIFAGIDRYDKSLSTKILSNENLPIRLANLENKDMLEAHDQEWLTSRERVRELLNEFHSINGVGLAISTKILHLKRPNLFPILDSLVVRFLTGQNLSGISEKAKLTTLGLKTLDIARIDLINNKNSFQQLQSQLTDLPIRLTNARIYDILCWTTEKWVNMGALKAPYGVPQIPEKPQQPVFKLPSESVSTISPNIGISGYVVFEDYEKATGPKVHSTNCTYYQRWLQKKTKTTTWHGPYKTYEEAWLHCQRIAARTGKKPSKHSCL